MEKVLSEWGRIDILVNNAGIIRDGLFVRMEPARLGCGAWRRTWAGPFTSAGRWPQQMALKQRSGRIINMSSVAAEHVNAGQCNYAASKGAVNSFTRALAVELAGRNVTVNAVAPGFIETDMSEAVRNKAGDLIKKMIPAKRLGQPGRHCRAW